MVMRIVLAGVIGLTVATLGALGYFGAFRKIEVTEREMGPMVLVYENHQGAYHKIAPVMDRVFHRLKNEDKIETTLGFGVYYDKPGTLPEEKLRAVAGCIVDGATPELVARLKSKYKVAEYPRARGVYAEFPLKGVPSFLVAPIKVYSAMAKYLEQHQLVTAPSLEIYDVPGKKIVFFMPIGIDPKSLERFLE